MQLVYSNFSWTILSKGKGIVRLTLCEAPTRVIGARVNIVSQVDYNCIANLREITMISAQHSSNNGKN